MPARGEPFHFSYRSVEKSFWKHLAGKQATKERVQSPAPGDRAWSRRDGSTPDLSLALLSLRKGHLPEGGLGQLRADLESWWGLRQTGKGGGGAGSGGDTTLLAESKEELKSLLMKVNPPTWLVSNFLVRPASS